MASQKGYGMRKEDQLADFLHRRGATVGLSPGSRGAADLKAEWPNGLRWHVQVKASRAGKPASPSPGELGRLRRGAARAGAIPVLAEVLGNRVAFWDVRST